MSLENAKKFIEQLAENKDYKKEIEDSMIKQFIQNAQKNGLYFTKEDFQLVWTELTKREYILSDDDLDKIAGGDGGIRIPVIAGC